MEEVCWHKDELLEALDGKNVGFNKKDQVIPQAAQIPLRKLLRNGRVFGGALFF